jgi:chemotaxis protein histidine kinase CheA
MATLREYFEQEASRYLDRLEATLADVSAAHASGELHRAARGLRGTAQLAREEAVQRVARALETAVRPPRGGEPPLPDLADRLAATLTDLRALVEHPVDANGDVAERAVARWRDAADPAEVAVTEAPPHAFFAFAATEVGGIADELERGVAAMTADPSDRAAIKRILRRQRALLGAARLNEVPVVAETLRALDDLSRVIAKLDVPVKGEWLDVFRCARDVLHVAAPALASREQPPATNGLSRLRTLREELLDRYGAGEVIAIGEGDGLMQPMTVHEGAAGPGPTAAPPMPERSARPEDTATDAPEVIEIHNLCYEGQAALRRALELRARLEAAVGDDPDALEIVDEVFDLIRLGLE